MKERCLDIKVLDVPVEDCCDVHECTE
jgi:hypothetical protein